MPSITQDDFSVYIFTFSNGKRYVGKTNDVKRRWKAHRYLAKSGDKRIVYHAIRKYGWESIDKEVRGGFTEAEAFAEEKRLIRDLKTHIRWGRGYNLTDGGEGASGLEISAETRKKMSEAKRGKPKSPEHRAKLSVSNRGQKRSPETCKKMSNAARGRKYPPRSPEHRAALSASQKAHQARVRAQKASNTVALF